jgi:hypothetical protein
MWPLALFYWVNPHAVTLLWLQDLVVVGGELVVLSWAREALAKSNEGGQRRAGALALVTVLLVATPWSWFTVGFDFHLEPFAALFALLAARDYWAGRRRRLFLWLPLTLACCAAAGSLYVIAVGLAGLVTRNTIRRTALAIVLAGCTWLALTAEMGAMNFGGQALGSMYGYLAGGVSGHFGIAQLLGSLAGHPLRAIEMFRSHADYVAGYVASGGVIGLRSRWGILPAVFVLAPNALNAEPYFIHTGAAFQSWAAVLFLAVGTVFAIQTLAGSGSLSRPAFTIAVFTGAVAVTVGAAHITQIPPFVERVSPMAAANLSAVEHRIPGGAEVVASQGIIGRFAVGRSAYYYWPQGSPEQFPVPSGHDPVVFIFAPVQGTSEGNVTQTWDAITYVGARLHARVLRNGSGIWAFIWVPRSGIRSVVLP